MFGCKPSHGTLLLAMCIASFANIFAAPVDIARAGARAHKIKKARKARAQRKSAQSTQSARSKANQTKTGTNTSRGTSSTSSNTSQTKAGTRTSQASSYASPNTKASTSTPTHRESTAKQTATSVNSAKKTTEPRQSTAPVKRASTAEEKKGAVYSEAFIKALSRNDSVTSEKQEIAETPKEPDENTPKSKPKHANDQYIRKRMIIAGSSYCDANVLENLKVGTYFELEAEPDNPHDKDAVKLSLNGEKIGYIAKADRLPFVTCLKLKRKVYGVITDIITESFPTKYEFETWFDQSK